ncbi:[FeFe] hydrogenase H-cluster maturation GTPase HydF [Sedimentibacter sp. MB31-C6]|uniref:[FeFe] hydrogenase H-cluster maturation GTPase HydF n=1 Tax=Sedimentibacter sp. MB31-C6 TaxID=3109366 RepID=UPI002DDD8D3D|nr:[FeFe] hydrogenase H-cluster maturation GTPase HydF [Sedimentibacter sp. MB36-C1]WSI03249.1 [FeFe] hydrogenase H-cluster maturation GTPase HydF [Sedimentibacter sp. MB36-C1]
MGLNDTPSANRIHIGFLGNCNVGKSSIVNAVTGQELALVSEIKGTTTDPVYKSMELLPIGPVMIIDTPGFDDKGELGELRIKKTKQVLNKIDVAVLIVDATIGKTESDCELIKLFKEKNINYIIVYNKCDLIENLILINDNEIQVSAKKKIKIEYLKEKIASLAMQEVSNVRIVADLIQPTDFVVLVIPIDEAAPKGRLILPQQQTIRDILEANATTIVVKECQLSELLSNIGKKPVLVITDSQVFAKVSNDTPKDIPLTSFSILMARYKGLLETTVKGVTSIDKLNDNDFVLISEGCTHHRQCNDIGTVKLPEWIKNYTDKHINFEFTSGREYPENLSKYKLIIHCGGCMLNEREMKYRMKCALKQNIPITNYGIIIAHINGILRRSIEIFPNILELLENKK